MVSQKVGFTVCVISNIGRNLVFSACYRIKISRFARNDKLLRFFAKPSLLTCQTKTGCCENPLGNSPKKHGQRVFNDYDRAKNLYSLKNRRDKQPSLFCRVYYTDGHPCTQATENMKKIKLRYSLPF